MPKVITFGNLPVEVGGRQTSGASVVMWQLADNINKLQKGYNIEFIATDIFKNKITVGHTSIYGWNYLLFTKRLILLPIRNIALIATAKEVSKKYKIPFFSVYVKMVLFNAVVKNNKRELFHIHGTDYFVIIKPILNENKIQPTQLLYTVHAIAGNDIYIPASAVERIKEQEIAAYTLGQLFFVSKQLQQEWASLYGPKESMVIPNGIGEQYLQAASNKPVYKDYTGLLTIVTIGSLTERKGQVRVLEALKNSTNKEKIIYKCIGDSDETYLNALQHFAKKNNIAFEYLGIRNAQEIIDILATTHYMILPSSSEGFGLVYLESLCTGTPVILPKNLPIVEEIRLDERNAILLEDYSSRSIKKVLNKIHLYSYRPEEILDSFTKLSWSDVAEMYIKQYRIKYEENR